MNRTAASFDLLSAFVAVAEKASFSQAARALGVSKGTMSRDIARLEAALGVQLLHRTTHKVALSTAGTMLYDRIAPHLGALHDAVGALPERSEQPSGELLITAPYDFGVTRLPELIAHFSARYPAVWVNLRLTNERLNLVTERIDLALRIHAGRMRDSTLVARRLSDVTTRLYAAPSYVARRGVPDHFGDPAHDWVLLPAMLRMVKSRKSFRPRALADDMLALRALALQGMGVCGLPSFLAAPCLVDGTLVRVMAREHSAVSLSIYAVYPSSGQVPRKVAAFRDFLSDRLKAMPLDVE